MNTCVYSSLVFLTNVVAAYLTGEYIYSMAFLALTCTSVALHSSRGTDFYQVLFWVDQLCMYAVVFCGACILIYRPLSFLKCAIAVLCFFADIYIHISQTSTDEDKWHSILHYVASLGHHCLLL